MVTTIKRTYLNNENYYCDGFIESRRRYYNMSYYAALNFDYITRNFCPKVLGMKNNSKCCEDKDCTSCWNKAILNHKKNQRRE